MLIRLRRVEKFMNSKYSFEMQYPCVRPSVDSAEVKCVKCVGPSLRDVHEKQVSQAER